MNTYGNKHIYNIHIMWLANTVVRVLRNRRSINHWRYAALNCPERKPTLTPLEFFLYLLLTLSFPFLTNFSPHFSTSLSNDDFPDVKSFNCLPMYWSHVHFYIFFSIHFWLKFMKVLSVYCLYISLLRSDRNGICLYFYSVKIFLIFGTQNLLTL